MEGPYLRRGGLVLFELHIKGASRRLVSGRPKSHVFGSVLGGFIETLDGFMSHVENSSSWGDGGDGVELVHCL